MPTDSSPSGPSSVEIDFFPAVGFASPAERAAVWHQYRTAATALAVLSQGWGSEPEAHDLVWSAEDAGWLARGTGPEGDVIGWLDLAAASLWIERRDPQEGAWIELEGRTPAEIRAWALASSQRLAGVDPTAPIPEMNSDSADTPYAFDDEDARADLDAIYEGAGLFLSVLAGDPEGSPESAPTISASTYEASTLITLGGEADTQPVLTLRVGVSPPDPSSGSTPTDGFWFVEEAGETRAAPTALPRLKEGNWDTAGPSSPRAFLPIADLARSPEGGDQLARLAAFVSEACNAWADSARSK